LAQLRNRNADWAEAAVRSAASLSASEALEQRVIDVVAKDVPDLLRQIDGRRVQMVGGEKILATAALRIERIEPDWRTRVLAVLTNPNVAYLLMLAGIYGLLLEGYHPGAILPGVVGAISLLLAGKLPVMLQLNSRRTNSPFFKNYNEIEGKIFQPLERLNAKEAAKLLKQNKNGKYNK